LIVDDDFSNVVQFRTILEEGGFGSVSTTKSGKEAIDSLRKSLKYEASDIDLILLSSSLPDMDVYELCHTLRTYSEWYDIPVIIVAESDGWWQENTARKSYEAGAADILFKPIRSMDLIPRITLALTLKMERDLRKRREEELENELAERKVMEARLQYLVGHDDLTGLSNRRRLEQALELAVIRARNFSRQSTLLYIDLDQFKMVNDSEGHDTGDRMLISVANMLRKQVKPADILARIGSDEFALLLENISEEETMNTAEMLRSSLEEFCFESGIRTYHICACVGVAMISSEEEITASDVLARADQACHIAKRLGRNKVHKFSHEDTELHTIRTDVHWVPLIRNALANDKFCLVFQPVVRMSDGRITHYEALIRMVGENQELHSPDEFIPVAERMGLIHHIDLWVVERAIDFLESLSQESSNLSLNINLSSHAFQDKSLLPLVQQKLAMTWVAAHRLTFEITETAAIANFAQTREMVARLRALGCRFALDDFGSGFNSFNYLKNFPVDYLKIDGTFIVNLVNDPMDQILVRSMIEIAKSLGKKTIAEYVENAEILTLLRDFGVDYVQGYYLGAPQTSLVEDESIISEILKKNYSPATAKSKQHIESN